MIDAGDLATFHPDDLRHAHLTGAVVMVMFCFDAKPEDPGLDRLWRVQAENGNAFLAFDSELRPRLARTLLSVEVAA